MKIMCMGDSITYGNGLTNLSDRWSDIVAARTGYTLVNLGIGGDTTGGMRHAQTFGVPLLIGVPIPFVPERFNNYEWFQDRDNDYITQQCERYAHVLRAYCTARDIPHIDYRSAFLNEDGTVKKDYYTDALHPNAKGHLAMAEVLLQRLDEVFPAT